MVEADAKFLEELEQQSSIKGLQESTLIAMLQELREMLRQFEVRGNIFSGQFSWANGFASNH